MANFADAAQKAKLYRQVVDLGLPKNEEDALLAQLDSIFPSEESESAMSKEDRQKNASENVEKSRKELEQVDGLLAQARELGMTEEDMAPMLGIQDEIFDELDITEEVRGLASMPAEGLTAGIIGDEVIAASRVALLGLNPFDSEGQGGAVYENFLKETRDIESETRRDLPITSFLATGIPAVASGAGLARLLPTAATATKGAAQLGGLGAVESGVYGFMEGEGGLEERAKSGAKFAALGGALGGGVGGMLGRAEGRALAREADAANRLETDRLQSAYLRGELVDNNGVRVMPASDDVINAFQRNMDESALTIQAQEGRALTGADYGKALQNAADELGVPLSKLRHAEMVSGKSIINFEDVTIKELRNRVGTLADDVGFNNGRYQPGKLQAWADDKIRSLARMAGKQVGQKFGTAVQRVASGTARRSAMTEEVLVSPNVTKFAEAQASDPTVKRLVLNMSNIDKANPTANLAQRKEAYDQLVKHIRTTYGEDALNGFETARRAIQAKSAERSKYVDSGMPKDSYYWPSRTTAKADDGYRMAASPKKTNTSSFGQRREQFDADDFDPDSYEDIMAAAQSWMRESDGLIEMFQKMKLENMDVKRRALAAGGNKKKIGRYEQRVNSGQEAFNKVRSATRLEGADQATALKAADTMMSLVNMGSRGPSNLIANIRKAAYMGTIGNPYSAVLNLGDTFNSMVNFGGENTVDAIVDMFKRRGLAVTVDDIGIGKQATGEFVKEGTRGATRRFNQLSDEVFKYSGFQGADRFGKNVALRAALKEGQQLASKGKLKSEWGHAFTDQELARLQRDLLSGKKTDIVTEFAAANLAKLQPSDMAQLPKWYLDHPNWRVLYMLRTFGLKQLEQIERLVIEKYKQGDKKEAFKNALAYTLIVGGGNAALNEGRQVLKGKEPSLEGVGMKFADHMLGALTVNTLGTYQLTGLAGGNTDRGVSSVAPAPISMLFAPMSDVLKGGSGGFDNMEDFLEDSETLGWLPWGRLVQSWAKD
jgi:hypothetical protein